MTKRDSFALVVGTLLTACVGASYTYYNPELPPGCYDEGHLIAHLPKDNKSMVVCKPDDDNHMKCVVLMTEEYTRLLLNEDRLSKSLIACQQRCGARP